MKMKAAKKVSYDSGPNMTPLVDVVMVILIFLMMVGNFGALEHYLLSNVPLISDSAPTQEVKSLTEIKSTVEIAVAPSNDGFGWRVTSAAFPPGKGNLDEVLQGLQAALLRGGHTVDNIQVIIAPQPNVQYMHLVKVYEAALRAKYTKVAFRGVS